jgi:hypothetical protein
VVHYGQQPVTADPIQRCPTGAIVWLDPEHGIIKGESAASVIRQRELPDTAT